MSQKKESALGRGLDALIRMEPEEKIEKKPSKQKTAEKPRSRTSKPKTRASKNKPKKQTSTTKPAAEIQENIQDDLVESVLSEVNKNPRISLWSARSAAVLRLLKKTKPEFSISKEASALIEDAVKTKYPELWEVFEDKNI